MRRAAVCAGLLGGVAHASPWTVQVEGGAEMDTNVQRVETAPGLMTTPRTAPVVRLGGRLIRRDKLFGGNYGIALSSLARLVAGDEDTTPENVVLLQGDARWLHPVEDRPISIGFAATGADAVPVVDAIGARTFRNAGGDALLSLRDEDERSNLTLAAGGRLFEYKPDPAFSWMGPTASLRLDLLLWQNEDKTKSLELAGVVGVDLRTYGGKAFASACPPEEPATPMCFASTTLDRRDRYHRAIAEVTWTGSIVIAGGYQLVVVDSNSYGQTLVRNRVTLSTTFDLTHGFYGTVLGVLQYEQYTDGLVIQTDPDSQSYTSLVDENRSSISLRIGRPVSQAWSFESRVAYWRNLGGVDNAYERSLVYFGAVYNR